MRSMPRTLEARHDRFALHTPFRIARGVKTAADVITDRPADAADAIDPSIDVGASGEIAMPS